MRRVLSMLHSPEGVSTFANLLSAGFSVLSFLFITRSFAPGPLGQWFLFLSGATLADMLRIGLVNKGFVYHYSGDAFPRREVTGSGLLLFLLFSTGIALLLFAIPVVAPSLSAGDSSWQLFFRWYPWFALVSVPHNVAEWIAQGELKFHRTLTTRIIVRGGLLGMTAANAAYHTLSIDQLAAMFVLLNAGASVWSLASGWTPAASLRWARKRMMSVLLGFGKYNALTQAGANLLRSSDSFFLGTFVGPASVARYGVPAKLLEIVELPLRSIGAAAYPEFSRFHQSGDMEGLKRAFMEQVVRLTLLVMPFLLLCAAFAEQAVTVFGGAQYRDTVVILYFFLAYCLLIPFDRFSGIFLDSLNRPGHNMVKVWIMLGTNCLADGAALLLFGTPEAVAAASLVTFLTGTAVNVWMIRSLTGWNPLSRHALHSSFRRFVPQAENGTV